MLPCHTYIHIHTTQCSKNIRYNPLARVLTPAPQRERDEPTTYASSTVSSLTPGAVVVIVVQLVSSRREVVNSSLACGFCSGTGYYLVVWMGCYRRRLRYAFGRLCYLEREAEREEGLRASSQPVFAAFTESVENSDSLTMQDQALRALWKEHTQILCA